MPYDPPNQAAYRHGGTLGWASYKVAPWVRSHEGWGLGSYCFFNVDPSIHSSHAFEVPVRPGVKLHDLLTLSITDHGTIDHVVNDYGPPTKPDTTPSDVTEYPPPQSAGTSAAAAASREGESANTSDTPETSNPRRTRPKGQTTASARSSRPSRARA